MIEKTDMDNYKKTSWAELFKVYKQLNDCKDRYGQFQKTSWAELTKDFKQLNDWKDRYGQLQKTSWAEFLKDKYVCINRYVTPQKDKFFYTGLNFISSKGPNSQKLVELNF